MIPRPGSTVKNNDSTGNECIGLICAAGIREEKLGGVGECQGVACESLLVLSIVFTPDISRCLRWSFKDIGVFKV